MSPLNFGNCKRDMVNRSRLWKRSSRNRRAGLTLLELLIVLVILAALATIAVQSLESFGDQARYDSTERTLNAVELAVEGSDSARQADGTPIMSGFVADVGRLPIAQGNDQETQLAELWNSTTTLATDFPFQVRTGPATPIDYSAVALPCGWRGPYLRFGVGETDLRDGWGEAFVPLASTLAALDGEEVIAISWPPNTPYVDSLSVDFSNSLATVSGTMSNDGSVPSSATVVMLVPDPEDTNDPKTLRVVPATTSTTSTFVFEDIPIGTRAIHATIDGEAIIKYIYVTSDGVTVNLEVTP